MTIDSVEMLFQEELKDVYDAELHLTKALPKMVKAAKAEELKTALSDHLEVTKTQVGRLEEIFAALGVKPVSKPCLAIKGLLAEGEEAMKSEGPGPLTDLSLIGAARRVEHYEMAAYLSLQDLAENLDNPSILELLASSLDEEKEADDALATISASLIEEMDDSTKKSPARKKAMTHA